MSVPGDKSISHRAVIIGSMAEGTTRIENFATGEDCSSSISCLRQLGVQIEQQGTLVVVNGVGKTGFTKPDEPLDCGNSGTTMRLLAGVLAGQGFESILTGDESLRKRPMNRIVEPLERMGARIETVEGLSPITIRGRNPLTAISYETPVASAQLKSCVLLAGLNADGVTKVIEKSPTRDHTERMLGWLGADLTHSAQKGNTSKINGSSILKGRGISIPGDLSSASFFIVATSCLAPSAVKITYVGINRTRAFLLDKLRSLGVYIRLTGVHETEFEPAADIRVHGTGSLDSKSDNNIVFGHETAQLIDEIPALAVLGTQLETGLEVRDAGELRLKETDRIAAIVENLRRMKADVEEFEDGFRIGMSKLKGAEIDSFGDHRIAMAFAVAGLLAEGETLIKDPECVDISFPGFFETLESVVKR